MDVGTPNGFGGAHEVAWLEVGAGPAVPVRFVDRAGVLYVVPTGSEVGWLAELLRGRTARIRLPYRAPARWSAALITEPARLEEIAGLLREKYGNEFVALYFPAITRALSFRPTGATEDPPTYHEIVRRQFDAIAGGYTAQVEGSPVNRLLRERSLGRLQRLFKGRDPLLELGSGTGRETLPLLGAGHRVVALDISPRMLEELRRQAEAAGLSNRLTTRLGAVHDLAQALEGIPFRSLGGAYCTFGALNLEPDLTGLPGDLGRLLEPGAPLFVGVLQRNALVPALYTVALGHPKDAFRWFGSAVTARTSNFTREVLPMHVRSFAKLMAPEFDLIGRESASVASPPIDLPALWRAFGGLGLRRAARWDEWLARRAWAVRLSEWVFLTFRRR
jgi:ubiquinone/menaquinone biosynthesis C-methylase UbiE